MNNDAQANLLVILGPTASGKTAVAAHWAALNNGEIISADSRQVYRGMTIGTGKDYADYTVEGRVVPCHLIDIADAGQQYNVYSYQQDFVECFNKIIKQNKFPVLCGGSGLYLEAALKGYRLLQVPVNEPLREELAQKSDDELAALLASLTSLHNHFHTVTRKRNIRAIEIALYQREHALELPDYPELRPVLVGVVFEREEQRRRITERLRSRFAAGMLEEVRALLDAGLTAEQLEYYGLEYKFMTMHLTGRLSYDEMFALLNTAIHQFAKRQMTWFRRMERNGDHIHWIDGRLSLQEKLKAIDAAIDSRTQG